MLFASTSLAARIERAECRLLEEGELEAVERAFAERGSPVLVEVSCLADPAVGALLTRRGYTLQGFENVLGRALPIGPPTAAAGVVVSPSSGAELREWLDVVVTGFALETVMGDLAAAEGFVRYLARRNGEIAGGASLRCSPPGSRRPDARGATWPW
jgi:hypothetical protein